MEQFVSNKNEEKNSFKHYVSEQNFIENKQNNGKYVVLNFDIIER